MPRASVDSAIERIAKEHRPGLAALRLPEKFLRIRPRRIVNRQFQSQVSPEQFLRKFIILMELDVRIGACVQNLGATWSNGLRTRKTALGFLEAALTGEELCQVDQSAGLLRRGFNSALEVLLRGMVFLLLLGKPSLRPMPVGGIQRSYAPGSGRSLLKTPSQEARRFHIILK